MQETTNNTAADILLDQFDLSLEKDQEEITQLNPSAIVKDEDTFRSCLAPLKERSTLYKSNVKSCDEKIKSWQEAKKHWQECEAKLNDLLATLLTDLNLPSLKEGNAKATLKTSKTLVVDEELMISQFTQKINELQAALPPYIKLKMTVDKTMLGSHVKTDPTLLIDHPEMAHWSESKSASIK